MALISLNTFLTISSLFLIFTTSFTSAQLPNNSTCETYVTYRVRTPYSDLGTISDLFGISRLDIATATSLASENIPLVPNQLLLVPIKCTSNGTHYFSNVTYKIKKDDSFYSVSIKPFQNLTNYNLVEEMNPVLNPNNLTLGVEAVFPLLCNCPGNKKSYIEKGIQYLITYVWQPGDDLLLVSNMFQSSPSDIVDNNNRNFTNAICLPVLIPVKSPIIVQHFASTSTYTKSKHHLVLVAVLSVITSLLILFSGLAVLFHLLYKKNKKMAHDGLCFKSSDIVHKVSKDKALVPKLLPGLSGYLGNPIMYDLHVIMKATLNLSERFRLGGSVYKAIIDGHVLAVKKTRDAAEELQILQRVNHANLVKLFGFSSDNDGNFFIVYEYVEKGSLDKWLFHSPLTVEPLNWNRRLFIALDVANGIQYMHEHTQPSIVHKDIKTSNILLDYNFKAKISNFTSSRRATSSIMLNVDVFSFGVVLLELLSGKKVIETKGNGEVVMLWKEIKGILEGQDQREEKLREWMDPNLKGYYPIEDAINMAILAKACTSETSLERPKMSEIVFNLCVLTQASPQMYDDHSLLANFEAEEVYTVISPVKAR